MYTSFFYFLWLLSPCLHLCFYFAVCCIRCPCPCLHAWVVFHRLWLPLVCLYWNALSLSTRASPLRVLGFLRRSALRRWSRSVSRPYKDSYDSSARPMGVASQNYTLPCAIATFPASLPLSSPGDVWPRLPLLPSTRP